MLFVFCTSRKWFPCEFPRSKFGAFTAQGGRKNIYISAQHLVKQRVISGGSQEMAGAASAKQTTRPAVHTKRVWKGADITARILWFCGLARWLAPWVFCFFRTLREKEDVANQPRGEIGLWMKQQQPRDCFIFIKCQPNIHSAAAAAFQSTGLIAFQKINSTRPWRERETKTVCFSTSARHRRQEVVQSVREETPKVLNRIHWALEIISRGADWLHRLMEVGISRRKTHSSEKRSCWTTNGLLSLV